MKKSIEVKAELYSILLPATKAWAAGVSTEPNVRGCDVTSTGNNRLMISLRDEAGIRFFEVLVKETF